MRHIAPLILAAAVVVSGCHTVKRPAHSIPYTIGVKKTETYAQVRWPLRKRASRKDLESLKKLLAPLDKRSTHIVIDAPLDLPSREQKRIEAFRVQLEGFGVHHAKIHLDATSFQDPSIRTNTDQIVIRIEEYKATPPSCPNWTRRSIMEPHANFGCANRSALAKMVADPRDLQRGQANGGFEGERANILMENYRADREEVLRSGLDDRAGA